MTSETKGAKTREAILQSAMDLFLNQGYAATSLRDIAQGSGNRAVGGIYNHFENKEAIFRSLLESRNPYIEIFPILETADGDTAPEFLRNVLRRILPLLSQHYDFIQLIQIDSRELNGRNTAEIIREQVLPRALTIVQRILARPGLKPMEPLTLIRIIVTMLAGYITAPYIIPSFIRDMQPADVWIERFIDILLHGITDQSPPDKTT